MNILVFYPNNKRTIPLDVPIQELIKKGHNVKLLTLSDNKGALHEAFEQTGAISYHHKIRNIKSIFKLLEIIRLLIRFCRVHKIDFIFSHLQQANLPAVLAQPFIKAKVIPFRHHCKFHHLVPGSGLQPHPNEARADRLINKYASLIVVPSTAVKDAMVEKEKVNRSKVVIIPYAYDFNTMQKVDYENIFQIRKRYNHKVLLIIVSRLTPYKRHDQAIETIRLLKSKGIDAGLLIMDEGPELESTKLLVNEVGLAECVYFCGFQRNVLEYITSADFLLNPSLTDASNSVVKEAGLMKRVVITCNNVGDCNDYIENGVNGFLVEASEFAEEAAEIITNLYNNEGARNSIGEKLKVEIESNFSMSQHLVSQYEALLNSKYE